MATGFFLPPFTAVFPLVFPLGLQNQPQHSFAGHALNELLHTCGTLLFHAVSHMSIDIQSKGGSGMTQVVLHGLDIITGTEGRYGIRMAEIVEPCIWTANRTHYCFIVAVPRLHSKA